MESARPEAAARPAILVANPSAQSGKAAEWIRRARALLDERGLAHQLLPTEPGGGTVEKVRAAIDDDAVRLVIYMGGDGTFAEVAKGILASAHPGAVDMGMLPTGTANDQGKSFGLVAGPSALEENVRVIAQGVTTGCDVGELEIERASKVIFRERFFDSFSVGLGAASLATRNRDRERASRIPGLSMVYRDHLVYAGALLQRFVESYLIDIKFDLDLVLDDRVLHFDSLLDVIIKNTRIFGGEWVFDPEIQSDDGKFELVPMAGRRDLTAKLVSTFRHSPLTVEDLRSLGISVADPVAGSRFELTVRSDGPLPAAQADGEELPAGERYRVVVRPRALRLIVPRDHVESAAVD
ncbi:MAG: diacylglycerol kinase family protein [Kofleriaceae bacterium]